MKSFRKLILPVLIITVVAIAIALALVTHSHNTGNQAVTKSVQTSKNTGLASIPVFVQKVYNARLNEWSENDSTFINNHRAWFSSAFVSYTTGAQAGQGSYLFCSAPKQKPTRFNVSVGSVAQDRQSAVVYISSTEKSPAVLNMPVVLKVEKGFWTISQINCNSI